MKNNCFHYASMMGLRYWSTFSLVIKSTEINVSACSNFLPIHHVVADFDGLPSRVRLFVARMPPADSTAGLACCLRSFSALGDQRAEILPVQRPPTLAVGERCMRQLTRIIIFPLFPLSIMDQRAAKSGCLFPKCPENFLGNLSWRIYVPTRLVHLV